jgi:hypothetical protein
MACAEPSSHDRPRLMWPQPLASSGCSPTGSTGGAFSASSSVEYWSRSSRRRPIQSPRRQRSPSNGAIRTRAFGRHQLPKSGEIAARDGISQPEIARLAGNSLVPFIPTEGLSLTRACFHQGFLGSADGAISAFGGCLACECCRGPSLFRRSFGRRCCILGHARDLLGCLRVSAGLPRRFCRNTGQPLSQLRRARRVTPRVQKLPGRRPLVVHPQQDRELDVTAAVQCASEPVSDSLRVASWATWRDRELTARRVCRRYLQATDAWH